MPLLYTMRRIHSSIARAGTSPRPYPATERLPVSYRVGTWACPRPGPIAGSGGSASMSTGNTADQQNEGAALLEQDGPVARITLSRPAALNALTWTMYRQLEAHLKRLAADGTTRAIIITGAGK